MLPHQQGLRDTGGPGKAAATLLVRGLILPDCGRRRKVRETELTVTHMTCTTLFRTLLLLAAPLCSALRQCGNTTTFCLDDSICCTAEYSPTSFGCRLGNSSSRNSSSFREWPADIHLPHDDETAPSWPPSPTASCCMPGPELPPSTTLPNCLVVGDSVSIGYTGKAIT